MTEKVCGALGCTNAADGVTDDGKHSCLTCADKHGKVLRLYE